MGQRKKIRAEKLKAEKRQTAIRPEVTNLCGGIVEHVGINGRL
jgi:hypothetical protein